ncbi:MAG: nitrilase-related carbon-nitrogen hydrolase [Alkalispirochaetaceae bacterium]
MRAVTVICLVALSLTVIPLGLPAEESGVVVAAVQFEVREEVYRSQDSLGREVSKFVRRAAAAGSDLVVFPEYLGVFLAAQPYLPRLASADTVAAAVEVISRDDTDLLSLRELFIAEAPRVGAWMDAVFGPLAREHGIHILAGTYFHASRAEAGEYRLTNRAVIYSPRGRRLYEQDKVFLTPFERERIGLDPGSLGDVEGVEIGGVSVGVTICQDTFYDAWDAIHQERELWIDIKADGVPFDQQARRRYYRTIPERLKETGVPYGVTVSLVGAFLDLFWEGRSSVVHRRGDTLDTLERTGSPRRPDLLVERIDP